jgi:hypothetical protein
VTVCVERLVIRGIPLIVPWLVLVPCPCPCPLPLHRSCPHAAAPADSPDWSWRLFCPVAASKYMGELIMTSYNHVYDLPTLNLRFFMVYGACAARCCVQRAQPPAHIWMAARMIPLLSTPGLVRRPPPALHRRLRHRHWRLRGSVPQG